MDNNTINLTEMVNLTAIWRENGSNPARRPALWLKQKSVKRLLEDVVAIRKGPNAGMWVDNSLKALYLNFLAMEPQVQTVGEPYMAGESDLPGEEWKPVPGFDGYFVSSMGRVRNAKQLLRPGTAKGNYHKVNFYRDGRCHSYLVHALVMRVFIGRRPDGFEVNHKNTIKTDNRLANLEYSTPRDNILHAARHNLLGSAKLTTDDVLTIRAIGRDVSLEDLASQYGVQAQTIRNVLARRSWSYIN